MVDFWNFRKLEFALAKNYLISQLPVKLMPLSFEFLKQVGAIG
jgi:hypothetical protein